MKKISDLISVPRECMSNLLVSLAAVIVFACAAIIPAYLSRADLEQKISNARYQLDQHQALLPLYESLKKAPRADFPALAAPTKAALKKAAVDSALTAVRDIAGKSSITVNYINPDLTDASAHSQSLALDVGLKGSFENFRTVLAYIYALPYVENLENISIQREPNGQALDFKMKIILALS
ncbi:MAG: type 4a pilus biogenesis protein PilO [Dissulfurispiraceae bacterium]|jgi:Tfp pilus assembly protein PilO